MRLMAAGAATAHGPGPRQKDDFPRSFRRLTLRSATGPAQSAKPYQPVAKFEGRQNAPHFSGK